MYTLDSSGEKSLCAEATLYHPYHWYLTQSLAMVDAQKRLLTEQKHLSNTVEFMLLPP